MTQDAEEAATSQADRVSNAAERPSVSFDYLKSNFFRIVHADGLIGSTTPTLELLVHFWSERFPIPAQVTHEVATEGTLGEEIKERRVSRQAVVRELEVGIVMHLDVARTFRDWLTRKIEETEKLAADHAKKLEDAFVSSPSAGNARLCSGRPRHG